MHRAFRVIIMLGSYGSFGEITKLVTFQLLNWDGPRYEALLFGDKQDLEGTWGHSVQTRRVHTYSNRKKGVHHLGPRTLLLLVRRVDTGQAKFA